MSTLVLLDDKARKFSIERLADDVPLSKAVVEANAAGRELRICDGECGPRAAEQYWQREGYELVSTGTIVARNYIFKISN